MSPSQSCPIWDFCPGTQVTQQGTAWGMPVPVSPGQPRPPLPSSLLPSRGCVAPVFPAGTRGVQKEVPARGEEEGTWSWSFQVCAHHLPGPIKRRRRRRRCHSAASSLGLHFPRAPPINFGVFPFPKIWASSLPPPPHPPLNFGVVPRQLADGNVGFGGPGGCWGGNVGVGKLLGGCGGPRVCV